MGHEITERADGTAEAAFALEPAWHGLGTVLDHPMSSLEALEAAQLDWEVEQLQIACKMQDQWKELASHRANVRSDNGFVLGVVSDQYKVVQNREAFGFLDALVSEGKMQYESAFSLSGGRKVVLLGRLPGVDQATKGDNLLRYVLMSLSHDGTGAIRFGPTSVRVVCANTYALALQRNGRDIGELSVSHMGDVKSKLEQARTILDKANARFDQYAETSQALASRKLTGAEWEQFLDVMCPELDPMDPDWTERREEAISATRLAIRDSWNSPRQLLSGIERSAWTAFNAVTEYIDHLPRRGSTRTQKAEARFNVCLYGTGRDMKKRAFEVACRFAGIAV